MLDREWLKSTQATPKSEDSAALERTAADVISKTYGYWMLRSFVPLPSVNSRVLDLRSSASLRTASRKFLA
jgi:hypothetical protein